MPELSSTDRLEALDALREHLATAITTCDSNRDLAALAGRLQSVLAEIAELKSEGKVSVVDDLASARAARRAAAQGS
jgi:hypothetical protein